MTFIHLRSYEVPTFSSGTLTNVLPHRNALPQTQGITPYPVTVYRHRADLSLCYPMIWNVTLEYKTTHFNVSGKTHPVNPSTTFHTHQHTLNVMMQIWWLLVRSSAESIHTNRVLNPRPQTQNLNHLFNQTLLVFGFYNFTFNLLTGRLPLRLSNRYHGSHPWCANPLRYPLTHSSFFLY